MGASPQTLALLALSALALQSVVPRTAVMASAEGQPCVSSPPDLRAPGAQARLLAALRSKIPLEPIELQGDPYVIWHPRAPPPVPANTVCGIRFEPDEIHYRLSTFTNTEAARTAGFAVTHFGACGTCSTLQDLSVYLEKRDLTAPVRNCGIRWNAADRLRCLKDLGFSNACARTWQYDVQNTRHQCFSVCVWSWIKDEPPTREGCRLNACLQCDEDRSGSVFKATAGRTRRNSGIHSSIPRPDDEIAPVVHDYIPDFAPR